MKKIIKYVLAVIIVLATIGFTGGVILYTHPEILHKVDGINVYVHDENGFKYTEASWDWKPINQKKLISYTDTSTLSKKYVSLCLNDKQYVTVAIPDKEYINDFDKVLYATDGSFMVRIVGNVSMDDIASIAGIDNGVSINQLSLRTSDNVRGRKTICTLVDTYAIIADVYSGNDNYSILLDSLSKELIPFTIDEVPYADNLKRLSKLSYTGNFMPQLVFQELDLKQRRYLFEDGMLWTQSVTKDIYNTENEYLAKMYCITREPIKCIYSDEGFYYAESGDYYLGLIVYNTNTTIALLGYGEESKCNIINIMASLR